jgi:hypothetical protein
MRGERWDEASVHRLNVLRRWIWSGQKREVKKLRRWEGEKMKKIKVTKYKLQTKHKLMKSFCGCYTGARCFTGAVFSKSAPPGDGGIRWITMCMIEW